MAADRSKRTIQRGYTRLQMIRRTKIFVTLGPSSDDEGTIKSLLKAGADCIRLNLSHGSADNHRQLMSRVREQAQAIDRHIPIMLDLMGPRYRLGVIPEGERLLRRRTKVLLSNDPKTADVPIGDPDLLQHLREKERVLIDNGSIELTVQACRGEQVTATVVSGGKLTSRKGINLPDSDLPFKVSRKDARDIRFAVQENADYLAASYVGRAADVEAIRKRLRRLGSDIPIVAKLERARAVENIDEIAATADGVMVARGDLGVEVPLHQVPTLQKRIINSCRRYGRPAIVATQMLESMMTSPRPTRAEASDVANSVFDGTDGLLLTGETAAGAYPVKAVRIMEQIVQEAESFAREDPWGIRSKILSEDGPGGFPEVADAVARAAVFTTRHLDVRHIVAFSRSGFTARLIARYRPQVPVLALTPSERVARRLQALWGVRPLLIPAHFDTDDEIVQFAEHQLRARRLVRLGDRLIVLKGGPLAGQQQNNMMRVHQVTR